MTKQELVGHINEMGSFLCVGLDPDLKKLPPHLLRESDPIFAFNKAIIDATVEHCVAYKPNMAFYEAQGLKGWESLKKTIDYIPKDKFTIADAKRGDIGNTARMYADAFYNYFGFDSITVAPYMGADSVTPFLEQEGKWAIVLGLTSNKGSNDFQRKSMTDGGELYEKVITTAQDWGTDENLMFVVGATRGESIGNVRSLAKDHFFLVPGVGAQGGSLEEVVNYGANDQVGLLVNSSRGIIYAGNDESFALAASEEARKLTEQMRGLISMGAYGS